VSGPPVSPVSGPPAGGALDAAGIRRLWDEVVITVGRSSKRAAAVAREAVVREVEGDTIVLLFQHQVHATMLTSSPEPVLDAVREVVGGTWRLRCESRDGGAGPASGDRRSGDTAATVPTPEPGGRMDDGWPEPARPGGAVTRAAGDRPPPPPAAPDALAAIVPAPQDGAVKDGAVKDGAVKAPAAATRPKPAGGEQEALDLLRRKLGAEKIGEVAP
jgi:DNA polymerase III subunit gamma/tau